MCLCPNIGSLSTSRGEDLHISTPDVSKITVKAGDRLSFTDPLYAPETVSA